MLQNFTALDVTGSVEAALLLSLFLFIPGYVIGWASNLFEFRTRRIVTQVLLSSPLAVSVVPIFTYFAGRFPKGLWTVFACTWLAFLLLAARTVRQWRAYRAPISK